MGQWATGKSGPSSKKLLQLLSKITNNTWGPGPRRRKTCVMRKLFDRKEQKPPSDPSGTGAFLSRLADAPTTAILQYPADDVDEHQLERDLCRESLIVNGSPVTAHQDLVDLAVLRRQVSDNVFVARTVGATTPEWRRAAIERMLQACDRTVAGGDTYTEVLGLLAEHATKFVATPSGSSAPAATSISTRTTYYGDSDDASASAGCKIDLAVVSTNCFDVVRLPLTGPQVAPVARVRTKITHRMVLTTRPPPSVATMSTYDANVVLTSDCVVRGGGERELAMKVVLNAAGAGHRRTSSGSVLPVAGGSGGSGGADATVLLAGQVWKLAHNRLRGTTVWKLRWIAITPGRLLYYRHKGDVKPKEVLDLREREIVIHAEAPSPGAGAESGGGSSKSPKKAYRREKPFRFSCMDGRTSADSKCHFAALTHEGRELWVRCLRSAVNAKHMNRGVLGRMSSASGTGAHAVAPGARLGGSDTNVSSPRFGIWPGAIAGSTPRSRRSTTPPRSDGAAGAAGDGSAGAGHPASGGSPGRIGGRRNIVSMRISRGTKATLAAVGGKLRRAVQRSSSKKERIAQGEGDAAHEFETTPGSPMDAAAAAMESPSQSTTPAPTEDDEDASPRGASSSPRPRPGSGAGGRGVGAPAAAGAEGTKGCVARQPVARRRVNVVVKPASAGGAGVSQPAFMRMEAPAAPPVTLPPSVAATYVASKGAAPATAAAAGARGAGGDRGPPAPACNGDSDEEQAAPAAAAPLMGAARGEGRRRGQSVRSQD